MKRFLIAWKTGDQYGVQWIDAASAVEAKGEIKLEIQTTQPYDYMQVLKVE